MNNNEIKADGSEYLREDYLMLSDLSGYEIDDIRGGLTKFISVGQPKNKTLIDNISKKKLFEILNNTNNKKFNIKTDKKYHKKYKVLQNIQKINKEYIKTIINLHIDKKDIISLINKNWCKFDLENNLIDSNLLELNRVLYTIIDIKFNKTISKNLYIWEE